MYLGSHSTIRSHFNFNWRISSIIFKSTKVEYKIQILICVELHNCKYVSSFILQQFSVTSGFCLRPKCTFFLQHLRADRQFLRKLLQNFTVVVGILYNSFVTVVVHQIRSEYIINLTASTNWRLPVASDYLNRHEKVNCR